MGRTTNIQWCDSTVNPVMGCDGCELWNATGRPGSRACYAGVLHERYAGTNKGYARNFLQPQTFPGRMDAAASWSDLRGTARPDKPWLDGLPRMIFVSDMGDALSESIDLEFLGREILDVTRSLDGLRHRWLWLTKRPRRMRKMADRFFGQWPDHLWAMTSITGAGTEGRADDLLTMRHVSDGLRTGLSIEPLRSEPDWSRIFPFAGCVDWAIFGGESGREAAPCDIDWIRRGVAAARTVGAAVFVKQLGAAPYIDHSPEPAATLARKHDIGPLVAEFVELTHSHGGDWSEWPDDLRIREVPQ